MRREARQRAERHRLRAEELRHLGALTNNPLLKEHYDKIAKCYLVLAEEEDSFAERMEEFNATLAERRRNTGR